MSFVAARGLRTLLRAASLIILMGGAAPLFAQDLQGGTGVFIVRAFVPSSRRLSPSVKPRPARARTQTRTQTTIVSEPTEDAMALAEDAIELGNAQRDSKPPRYAEAERAYRLAEKINPKDARPHAWLGDIYFDQQRFAEAEASLRRAVTLDATDAISYVRLSYMYSKVGRFDEADEAARRVQELKPNEFYGYCSMGWSKFRRKSYAEAETAYRRAIELSPKTSGLHSDMALVLLTQSRVKDAVPFFRQALQINPANVSARINYGVALHKLGQLDDAIEQYTRAIEHAPAATQPRSNLGAIYFAKGDGAKARGEWEAAARLGSAYPLDRAGLLVLEGKLNESLTLLEQFTASNATNADGWMMLGDVRRARGDESGARAAYDVAAKIAPDYARLPRPALAKQSSAPQGSAAATQRSAATQSKEGRTPSMAAAQARAVDKQVAPARVAGNGGEAKSVDRDLILAAARGSAETINSLLKSGADVNAKDKFGQTALIYAAGHGYADVVKALLVAGADVNAASNRGVTALKLAQANGHREVTKLLKQAGATR
ncbi:MAG TPA: tetratricopeptide repeat protein [Pyrinomonadaceae bacterium]|nr:tetratricopeptide repeat protein [Pyrinomonadaceae bacterium]